MTRKTAGWLTLILILLFAITGLAQQPTSRVLPMSVLTDYPPGETILRLSLYTSPVDITSVFDEMQSVRVDESSVIHVLLGNATSGGIPSRIFADNPSLYLGVSGVPGRTPIYAAGYAFFASFASFASQAGRLTPDAVAEGNLTINGNVGIGTTSPGPYKLHVAGKLKANNVQAKTVSVSGCGSSVCSYAIPFDTPFSAAPAVTCSAGPYANPNWGPLPCMVLDVNTTQVSVMVDSGHVDQRVYGEKRLQLIAIEP